MRRVPLKRKTTAEEWIVAHVLKLFGSDKEETEKEKEKAPLRTKTRMSHVQLLPHRLLSLSSGTARGPPQSASTPRRTIHPRPPLIDQPIQHHHPPTRTQVRIQPPHSRDQADQPLPPTSRLRGPPRFPTRCRTAGRRVELTIVRSGDGETVLDGESA